MGGVGRGNRGVEGPLGSQVPARTRHRDFGPVGSEGRALRHEALPFSVVVVAGPISNVCAIGAEDGGSYIVTECRLENSISNADRQAWHLRSALCTLT